MATRPACPAAEGELEGWAPACAAELAAAELAAGAVAGEPAEPLELGEQPATMKPVTTKPAAAAAVEG